MPVPPKVSCLAPGALTRLDVAGCQATRRGLAESTALDLTAVRALETADRTHTLWTDADRAWASRAAGEVVGQGGSPQAFLAQRARLALARLGERFKAVPRAVRTLRWRPWLSTAIVAAAFAAGVVIDRIGNSQGINVLTPPVLTLLAWNLAVYGLLAVRLTTGYGKEAPSGPLRRAVTRLAAGLLTPHAGGELGTVLARLASDWSRIAAPLYAARAARILHLAAALLAAGLLAGLYLRGMVFEYRASWQSTFLDAGQVHQLLGIALSPGTALTGIAVPAAGEIEAIRAPGGENAARWLHLMAATVAVVVIVPRLLLGLFAWLIERHRATNLPIALEDPYFQRLLRDFDGGPARVSVVPYSYTVPPTATAGLERLVARAFGAGAALTISPPVGYGGEDALPMVPASTSAASVIVLFNATATPEREAHGAFLTATAARFRPAGVLLALVDESAFNARWGRGAARTEERRRAWRELCGQQQVPCAFADLAAAGADLTSAAAQLADAQTAIETALAEATR